MAGLGDLEPVTLRPGQECELDDLLIRLVEIGYSRADMVGSRGEIAVRGGIVDVFPPTEEHPLRIEFFGDTIEEIRYFKVADQRSIGPAEHGLWAPPCRELLLTPAVRERAKELADTHPALSDTLSKLAEGIAVEGMEAFAPVLADRMDCSSTTFRRAASCSPATRSGSAPAPRNWPGRARSSSRRLGQRRRGGEAPIDLGAAAFQPIERVRVAAAALGLPWWTIAPFGVTDEPEPDAGARSGSSAERAG